jgi:hypothetical protein
MGTSSIYNKNLQKQSINKKKSYAKKEGAIQKRPIRLCKYLDINNEIIGFC